MFPDIPQSGASTREKLEKLEDSLTPSNLELPEDPEVVALKVEPSEFVSEDALRVWVVVPDKTPEELLDLAHLRPIRRQVERAFAEQGISLIPLAKFRTVSEYKEETGEEL